MKNKRNADTCDNCKYAIYNWGNHLHCNVDNSYKKEWEIDYFEYETKTRNWLHSHECEEWEICDLFEPIK